MSSSEIVSFLSSVQGFEAIAEEELRQIADAVTVASFEPGELLMRAGEPGETMHVVREGAPEVLYHDDDGHPAVFLLGPGDLVGEMALLSGEPRLADVRAGEEPVRTYVFEREIVEHLLEEHPKVAAFLSEILGRRLEAHGGIDRVGKYQILGKLGEGTTGKVFRALHPGLGRTVAVKVLHHSLVYQARFRDRFLEEARTVAGLSHPNIVQVFDTGSAYATYYLVMEELPRRSLSELVDAGEVLEPARASRILLQMAQALAYAHQQGFAHRDVKPANVSLDERGLLKLMDFGLALPIEGDAETGPRTVDGTPRYIAPETARGRPTDGRVDIYALGVIAFELLTGLPLFEASTPIEMLRAHVRTEPPDLATLRPSLPASLVTFVQGALQKDPEQRLTDWEQIIALLGGDSPSASGWSDASDTVEEVIRIRYRPEARGHVAIAVEGLLTDLATEAEVDVLHGTLKRSASTDEESES